MNPTKENTLPQIRQDLEIFETSAAEDGSKRWRLFDASQNKYFTLTPDSFTLLSLWNHTTPVSVFIQNIQKVGYDVDENTLNTFIHFLSTNNLIKTTSHEDTKKLISSVVRKQEGVFKWLLHNYLFIRLPLFKPDKFLQSTLFFVQFFYTKIWRNFVFLLGFIGIVLALRNWDAYLATFDDFFTSQGIFYYFLSLLFIKSLHELGHAYTAKKYGCRVPTMGLAFLVLFPLLYTDTTDAWKLKSKHQRLRIVFAGIKVELYIAMIATFLYAFTPDGTLKSIFFILATTSWITSILLNISPFLRFDGYYALSDWTDSENLQPRSFSMAKWFLRKNILGIAEDAPEYLSTKKRNFFILYAILTWIYRLVLFLGIALLVYYFAFKVLGIILFLVEIVWFILLPIYRELLVWWRKRKKVRLTMKSFLSLSAIVLLVTYFFMPTQTNIHLPAVLKVNNFTNVYASKDAQIALIHSKHGDFVKKGSLLIELNSPDLNFLIQQCKSKIQTIKDEIKKYATSVEVLENIAYLEETLIRKEKELEGLREVKKTLLIRAPQDGYVSFTHNYTLEQWVNTKSPLVSIYDMKKTKVVAFAGENELSEISIDSRAYFLADIPKSDKTQVTITSISDIAITHLLYPELSSAYGGPIAIRQESQNKMYTQSTYYELQANVSLANTTFYSRTKGVLSIQADRKSMAERFYIKALSVLVRESGF